MIDSLIQASVRCAAALVVTAVAVAFPGSATDACPYGASIYYEYGASRELAQIRRDLRGQRQREAGVRRDYEEELQSLRRQAFGTRLTSARQACYYRTTGGFEVCADLFAPGSTDRDDCEALVVRRNPGCNELPAADASAGAGDAGP